MARTKLTIDQIKLLQETLDAKALANHEHALNDLTDVVLTVPSTGQILKFDGTNWVNADEVNVTSFAELTDVDLTGLQAGQTIKFNGTVWVPVNEISMHQQVFTATEGQTNFTLTVAIAAVNISIATVNGVQQILGTDYTVTGTAFNFTYGLTADDQVIITYFNK